MKSSLALCLVCALFATALGQQSNPPQPQQTPAQQQQTTPRQGEDEVVKITTNLVRVDAVVTDRSGEMLTDLRPEEFQIFEDARAQKITNFSYVELAPEKSEATATKPAPVDMNAPSLPPARLRPEEVRRTIALVADDLGLSFGSAYCNLTRSA